MRRSTALSLRNKCVHALTPKILRLGAVSADNVKTKAKTVASDVTSMADIGIDRLLYVEIKKHFPEDAILSEEKEPDTRISDGYTWVIDPICGSVNLARGLQFYSTNIALLYGGRIVAAWVVDHSRRRLLWSIGDHAIYEDTKRISTRKARPAFQFMSIDHGYLNELPLRMMKAYLGLFQDLYIKGNLASGLVSMGSSLAFAYVATRQLQGAITIHLKPWDIYASIFLIEQSGGTVTTFSGKHWNLQTRSFIMTTDRHLHQLLLHLVKQRGLQGVQ